MVNKLVTMNMNLGKLKRIDPVYFKKFVRPSNLKELVNIWRSKAPVKGTKIEIFTGKQIIKPERVFVKKQDSWLNLARLAKALLSNDTTMEEVVNKIKEAVEAAIEEKMVTATARDLKGRAYRRKIEARPRNQPTSSLSAISGGDWLKEEMEKAEREIKKVKTSSKRSSGKQKKAASGDRRKDGNAGNCKY